MSAPVPNDLRLRIRAFYAVFFVFVGAISNFLVIWLRHHEWTDGEIGWSQSLKQACLVVFPIAWGLYADRRGPVRALRVMSTGALLALLPLPWLVHSVPLTITALTLVAAFFMGIMVALDSMTLRQIETHGGNYVGFRVWGSVGFLVGAGGLGILSFLLGREAIPWTLIAVWALFTAMTWQTRRSLNGAPSSTTKRRVPTGVRTLLLRPDLRAFYGVVFLSRVAAQGVTMFLPLHLQSLGVADLYLPVFWGLGVVSEILLLRNAHRLFGRFRRAHVLVATFAVLTLQYGLIAVIHAPWWLLLVMVLHGFTFGIWYTFSITWLGMRVDAKERSSAQALFQVVGFGLGGTVSALAVGAIFEYANGFVAFGAAAGVAGLTTLIAARFLRGSVDPDPSTSL